jgi:hypothetical protein
MVDKMALAHVDFMADKMALAKVFLVVLVFSLAPNSYS